MPALSDEEIEARLRDRPRWDRRANAIARELRTADFAGSVELLNRIAAVAEEMNHHPDVSISWNRVGISLTTHSEGGVTAADFELVRRIDDLA